MSAFEEGDFDVAAEDQRHPEDARRRSRSRRKRSRDGPRRRGSRNRRKRSESQRRRHRLSPSPDDNEKRLMQTSTSKPSILDAPTVVKQFPYDCSTVPTTDWFCWLCGNPNFGGEAECRSCGSQHIRGRTSKFSCTELLSDFLPHEVAERCVCSRFEHVATAVRNRVDSTLRVLPAECQQPHLYEVDVLPAVSSAGAGVLDDRSDDRSGFVVALRFMSSELARAALIAMKCKLTIEGSGASLALRIGFSTRKDIPKPPLAKATECEPQGGVKQNVWVPPQWASLEELRVVLISLNSQWDTLGAEQQRFYNENISKIATLANSQQQGTSQQQSDAARSPTTPHSLLSAASTSSIADMKKRLEEKKLALEQKAKEADEKRKQEEEAEKKAKADELAASTSNKSERDSKVIASTHALLARIAQKKAMTQQKQPSEVAEETIEQKRQKLERREIIETVTLAHVLPLPPKFPSVTQNNDGISRVFADRRAVLLLERIPFDIAQRILSGVVSFDDPRGSL